MSRSPMKRAFGSLRRLIRRRRTPSEQEWLRLILLVRRMQRGQLAVAHRLDEVRALTGVLGSFRSDFGALHEQLTLARESAADLERGLAERLARLDHLPDSREERAAIERRLASLDRLANRLEMLAAQAPSTHLASSELTLHAARLGDLATRLESAATARSAPEGQDELARLYERMQELAEDVARRANAALPLEEIDQRFMLLGEQLGDVHAAVRKLGPAADAHLQESMLARLERLATRFERQTGRGPRSAGVAPEELIPLLARVEALTLRLDQAPESWPAARSGAEAPVPAAADAELERELEELRVHFAFEVESRQRTEKELEALRERLRACELARVELETKHASELSQMADHVGRQIQRLEDDLRKKKRGLSELTEQNIQLQNQLARVTGGPRIEPNTEPPPPLPRSPRAAGEPDRTSADRPEG